MSRFVCLVGNGLSIAFNPELHVDRLTVALREELRHAGAAVASLVGLAHSHSSPGFEEMLGPLDRMSSALRHLPGLLPAVDGMVQADREAVERAAHVCRRIYDSAVGIVLGRIATLSRAGDDTPNLRPVVQRTCGAIAALDGRITVATLNYDGLLHAGFLRAQRDEWGQEVWKLTDMSAGYARGRHQPIQGQPMTTYNLRTLPNFLPEAKVCLLNLHGSLMWIQETETESMYKVKELEELRRISYWEELRHRDVGSRPLVILTDQKRDAVQDAPFTLAYFQFLSDLRASERWLIAGYGFRDEPVNAALNSATRFRREQGLTAPTVLVLTVGDAAAQQAAIASRLNLPEQNVLVDTAGIPDGVEAQMWGEWAR